MNWENEALKHLKKFAEARKKQGRAFLAEDFVHAYSCANKPMPTDKRRFGYFFYAAKKAGIIKKVGYAHARTSNNNQKSLWSSV